MIYPASISALTGQLPNHRFMIMFAAAPPVKGNPQGLAVLPAETLAEKGPQLKICHPSINGA